jgi:hypothetical protein
LNVNSISIINVNKNSTIKLSPDKNKIINLKFQPGAKNIKNFTNTQKNLNIFGEKENFKENFLNQKINLMIEKKLSKAGFIKKEKSSMKSNKQITSSHLNSTRTASTNCSTAKPSSNNLITIETSNFNLLNIQNNKQNKIELQPEGNTGIKSKLNKTRVISSE